MNEIEFTVADGLEYQRRDLDFWKSILNEIVFAQLHRAVINANATREYKSGYDVIRGQSLQNWVLNYRNEYKPF